MEACQSFVSEEGGLVVFLRILVLSELIKKILEMVFRRLNFFKVIGQRVTQTKVTNALSSALLICFVRQKNNQNSLPWSHQQQSY